MADSRRLLDLAWRVALVDLAAGCAAAGLPAAVTTASSVLAFAAVAEATVRRRGLGWPDALLVSCAGLLVALTLLGLALNLLPGGVARMPTALGAGVVAIAVLLLGTRRGEPRELRRLLPSPRAMLRHGPWLVGAAGLAVAALLVSVHATDLANRAPAQLSVLDRTGPNAEVEVQGNGRHPQRYLVVVQPPGAARPQVREVHLATGQRVRYRVPVAAKGATVVVLRTPGAARATASLILRPVAT